MGALPEKPHQWLSQTPLRDYHPHAPSAFFVPAGRFLALEGMTPLTISMCM